MDWPVALAGCRHHKFPEQSARRRKGMSKQSIGVGKCVFIDPVPL